MKEWLSEINQRYQTLLYAASKSDDVQEETELPGFSTEFGTPASITLLRR